MNNQIFSTATTEFPEKLALDLAADGDSLPESIYEIDCLLESPAPLLEANISLVTSVSHADETVPDASTELQQRPATSSAAAFILQPSDSDDDDNCNGKDSPVIFASPSSTTPVAGTHIPCDLVSGSLHIVRDLPTILAERFEEVPGDSQLDKPSELSISECHKSFFLSRLFTSHFR